MAAGPGADAVHQGLSELLVAAERNGEPIRLLGREIFGLDELGFRCAQSGARLLELALRRAARERESQASEVALAAAVRVATADGIEQVCGERQR